MGSDAKSKLSAFTYQPDATKSLVTNHKISKINVVKRGKKNSKAAPKDKAISESHLKDGVSSLETATTELKDLAPSLSDSVTLLFIGFNPGVESSKTQHHYAHHSNLFWKLFNQANILQSVVSRDQIASDDFLGDLLENGAKPHNDYELIRYNIAFTDLVLRCTKTAQELSAVEKLQNVPRLIAEFNQCQAHFIVVVGKGIWETIVKYLAKKLGIVCKLTKTNFFWGQQTSSNDVAYNLVLKSLQEQIPSHCRVFVFPNTSGLVGSLTWSEKLALWNQLSNDITATMNNAGH